jgi:glycosyltransferase involved in cell wall biosynthesis
VTRVAFALSSAGSNWTGGVTYFANLLHALRALPDRRIETVVLTGTGRPAEFDARFPADRVVETDVLTPGGALRSAGKVAERLIGRNLAAEGVLRRHRIDVLSHVTPLGRRSPVPTLPWVPDLQEAHLPGFFSADELARRAAGNRLFADAGRRVIVSSEHARGDWARLYPDAAAKARVLRFVSGVAAEATASADALRARYNLPGRFFHLPNQLWVHKNHIVVARALRILKDRGIDATVISTGATTDYRHPEHFAELQREVARLGVADRFRFAGLVPFADVAGLLSHAVAVINPSLFEGWSTTVEESKSLGKRVLLSEIPVHVEQAPERGHYFATDDAERLAELMAETLAGYDPAEERRAEAAAAAALPGRVAAFARTYEDIVLDALGRG